MPTRRRWSFAPGALLLLAPCVAPIAAQDGPVLWYRQPAASWNEALPVGNGRHGAMVFGRTAHERIQLNVDSLWAGRPEDRDRAGAAQHLAKARELLFAGQHREAEQLVQREFMSERWVRSHQTLGELSLAFPGHERVEDYRRELDLRDGIATVRYRLDGTTYTREVFAGGGAVVVHLTSDRPGAITVTARLARPEHAEVVRDGDALCMTGRADAGERHEGVRFAAVLLAGVEGVRLREPVEGGPAELCVEGADAVTWLVTAETDYRRPGRTS